MSKFSQSKGLPIEQYVKQVNNLYEYEGIEDSSAKIPVNLHLTENMLSRFITNTKSHIRNSLEYKLWVKWFREVYGPEVCCVSHNIVNIEVHHHPIVLEDYIDLAFLYLFNNNIAYTTTLLADLVLRFHYENVVGACFMSETYHVRYHELHDITVPENAVKGDLEKFLKHPILGKFLSPNLSAKFSLHMPEFCSKFKDYFRG